MLETAKERGAALCDVNYGYDIVKSKAAFEYLQSNVCDSDKTFKEPEDGCTEVICTEDSQCSDGGSIRANPEFA